MGIRKPTLDEIRLLGLLIDRVKSPVFSKDWAEKLMVTEMNDDGMGSLRLYPDGSEAIDRKFGKQVSECQFIDKDRIEVIASLNLDQIGSLYELDIWKTNFEKLLQIPIGNPPEK